MYTNEQILEFLRNNPVMSISACNNGKPLSSIVLFVVEEDFTFYFTTHQSSFKAKALRQNPSISLSVWAYDEMLVQADGIAFEITDYEQMSPYMEKIATATQLAHKLWPPLLRVNQDHYCVFKIRPTWLRVLDLKEAHISEKEPPFTQIEL